MMAFLFVLTFATTVNAGWGNWLTSLADAPTSEPTFTSAETSCLDTIEWCRDPHHFMYPGCGSWVEGDTPAPTTSDFDPTTCQVLYNMIDQNNCILQAFRSTDAPCAGVPVPGYNNDELNVLEASVACKRFSMAQMECVSLFSIRDPTLDEVNEAVNCILERAGRHEYKHNKDAQECLQTPKPNTVSSTVASTNADAPTSEPTFSSAETSCLDTIEWCQDPHHFMYPGCGSWVEGDTPAPTTSDFDPTTCQTMYNMLDQNNCILQAFRSTDAPCAGVKVPEYNTDDLNVLEASVACKRFSMAQMECVSLFSVRDPTLDDVDEAVDCILERAGRHEYKHNKDAQLCLKTPKPSTVASINDETNDEPTSRPTLSGMVHKEPTSLPTLSGMVLKPKLGSTTHGENNGAGNSNPVDCTSWFCPCSTTTCRGRRLLTGGSSAPSGNTNEKQTDQIPFIPMMAAATVPSDPTCADVLDWCLDSYNFMVKDCPNFSTAKDFDSHTCQNLYTILGQSDCIVRAFRGQMDEDPCSNVKLPYGDFDEETIEMDTASVACENFSFVNSLCVNEFSKLNPTDEDHIDAFKCIFDAAEQPDFAEDYYAKECLKFKAMLKWGF